MFLNYSALESGKLVLQLRENDLRDCLDELSKRWFEAFQRKGVRLEAKIDPSIPTFRFDYQKVQQVAANLIVETECRYGRVNLRFEAHSFALKGLKPPLEKLIQANVRAVMAPSNSAVFIWS